MAEFQHFHVNARIISDLVIYAEQLLPYRSAQRLWNSLENPPTQLLGKTRREFVEVFQHFHPFLCALPLHLLLLPLVLVEIFRQCLRVYEAVSNKNDSFHIIIINRLLEKLCCERTRKSVKDVIFLSLKSKYLSIL